MTDVIKIAGTDADLLDTGGMTNEQWLEVRKTRFGASDVAAILGVSPWGSPWSVWAEKMGLFSSHRDDLVLQWGKDLEIAIERRFMRERDSVIVAQQHWATHPQFARVGATLDGLEAPALDKPVVAPVDYKTGSEPWEEVPMQYACQGQMQMLATGLDVMHFALFVNTRHPLYVYEVERNQSDIDFILERLDEFWDKHIVTAIPPATDGHDATLDALAKTFPEHVEGKSVDLDGLIEIVEAWRHAKKEKEELEAVENAAKARIIEALGDAEVGVIGGERVFTYKTQEKTTAKEAKRIAQEFPGAEKYITTTKHRVLRDCVAKEKTKS
jgi:putative phage-type endonuclease